MVKYALGILAIGIVVVLGMVVDVNSRPPVRREAAPLVPSAVIYAPGRIEGLTPEIELRCQLAGRIAAIHCAAGDLVEPGRLLLELDDGQHREDVALAAAQLAGARARLQRVLAGPHPQERHEAEAIYQARLAELQGAQLTFDRQLQLRHDGAIAQQQLDDQRTLLRSLEAQVAAARARVEHLAALPRQEDVLLAEADVAVAQARLEQARVQLAYTKLHAPQRGMVLCLNAELGELTGPAATEPPVILADMTRLQVRAFVEEQDAPRIRVGMQAAVTAEGLAGQVMTGQVVRVSPHMTSKQIWTDDPVQRHDAKQREVWIELQDASDLLFGLRVDVELTTNHAL